MSMRQKGRGTPAEGVQGPREKGEDAWEVKEEGRAVSTLKNQIRNSYRQRADENIRTTIYANFYRILEHVYFVYAFPIKECIVYLLSC